MGLTKGTEMILPSLLEDLQYNQNLILSIQE